MDGADRRDVDDGAALLAAAPLRTQSYRALERKAGVTMVLLANALERVTFFSATTSLVFLLYAWPQCWSDQQAATAGYVFIGLTSVLCLLGGLLADCALSKFAATAIGYAAYVAALVAVVVYGHGARVSDEGSAGHESNSSAATCSPHSNGTTSTWCPSAGGGGSACATDLMATLVGVAAGAALVNTNLAAFGADQVRQHGMEVTRGFFSWLCWTDNLGAAASITGIAYLQILKGFFFSSLTSLGCLLLSAAIFFGGLKRYVRHSANRKAIKNFLAILPEAQQVKKQSKTSGWPHQTPQSTLDYAKVYYGGSYHDKAVEEVKAGGRMLLIYVLLIPYWIGFSQLVTTFLVQGLHMKAPTSNTSQIPPTALLFFNNLSVLISLPLLNNCIYPYIGRRGLRLNMHIRISIGMLFASLAFVAAGCVETLRLHSLGSDNAVKQQVGRTVYYVAPMSALYQIPQYALLGISEAFTYVTAMEYAYLVAPKAMCSIMIGILKAFGGVGTFVAIGLQTIYTTSPQGPDINQSHYDYIFYILAGLQLVAAIVFLAAGKRFDVGLDRLTILVRRPLPPTLLDQPTVQAAGQQQPAAS